MVWYCEVWVVPSFSTTAVNGVLDVPVFATAGWAAAPNPPDVEAPNPLVVFVAPKPPAVEPPPNNPVVPVVPAPKAGLFAAPKIPPPAVLVLPKAGVVVVFELEPNPPPLPNPPVPAVPVLPNRPPVVPPKGFAPKAVLVLLVAPKARRAKS